MYYQLNRNVLKPIQLFSFSEDNIKITKNEQSRSNKLLQYDSALFVLRLNNYNDIKNKSKY